MLRLCRNHSAFNSHNFPRTYTTTYPYVAAPPQPNALTRKAQGFGNYLVSSGCTYGLVTVSFHSICVEVSFATVSAQSFARASPPFGGSRCHHRYGLLATHLAIVYSVYSAYLPGLHSARPSAFVEGEGFEPPMSCITLYYQLKDASVDNCRRCFRPLSQPSFGLLYCDSIAITSCRHTSRPLCSAQSGTWDMPTAYRDSHRSCASPSHAFVAIYLRTSPTNLL